ncbi:MAG: hypothetical protein M1826_002068 [Phylliscum demangeonii]|nr:MAG: hypothetical protein M1826_002068 [Phylliscum demangeonii]
MADSRSEWVAAAGLDHRIRLWDLNGAGQRLEIDVGQEAGTAKGSVYALAVGGGLMASGGPESIVRIWDPRSGRRVTKLVGHTDNIRDILISDSGDTILTASSDQTVKAWSISVGRVLALDTAGEVTMWDLIRCEPVQSFGKRHLEDIAPEVNTSESIANWCSVDTRTGWLTCVLEEPSCFDGEMYADDLPISDTVEFREDQRINLGKWVLRYLFSSLIDEEIRRDEAYRKTLIESESANQATLQRRVPPPSIQLPESPFATWQEVASHPSERTPRAEQRFSHLPVTPGFTIGAVTPAILQWPETATDGQLAPTTADASTLERSTTQHSQPRSSSERANDYFSANSLMQARPASHEATESAHEPGEGQEDRLVLPSSEPDKENPGKDSSFFGKKFRIPFSGKKPGRTPSVSANHKTAVADERVYESDETRSANSQELAGQEAFLGVIQRIRQGYVAHAREHPAGPIPVGITPSLPTETPVLKPPPLTTILIQEDRPESGGVADLYRGSVASVGRDADVIERIAPIWLGDLLLRNQTPFREVIKVSFILLPYQDQLPGIVTVDGNSRLHANRMLRVKKILAYAAERLEMVPEAADAVPLKPEEYLELYCQNQLLALDITLAALRAHVWKGGGDVLLYYKSNGRRRFVGERMAHLVMRGSGLPPAINGFM